MKLLPFRQPIYRAAYFSWMIVLIIAIFATLISHLAFAKGILAGSTCWLLATLYLAWRLFSRLQWQAQKFIHRFFRHEMIKLILTAILFIAMIKLLSLSFVGMSLGYMIAQLSFAGMLAIFVEQRL